MTGETSDAVAFMSRWYDVRTNAYIEWCYGDGRDVARDLAAACGLQAGMRVLEVGCNIGNLSLYLAREYGCFVVGVDASRAAVEVAQVRAQENPPPAPAVFYAADARATPFDDGEFDAVLSKDTFVNIADKPRLLREMHRLLRGPDPASGRAGGRLAFTDWMQGNPQPTQAYRDWREFKKDEPFDIVTLDGYAALLGAGGFRVIDRRDRGETYRRHMQGRYEALLATEPIEMERLFGIADYPYFVQRFGLARDVWLAGDVTWGLLVAEKETA
jgi:ubiquinone/menaquinone biosynthesis C-methylase UbiE